MVALIFDSTPLIHLGRARLLEKVRPLSTKNYIPKAVYQEVVELGKSTGKENAFYVEKLISEGLFEIVEVKAAAKALAILSPADQEVLTLAKERKGVAVMDEDAGRKVAEIMGIKTLGSVGLLFAFLHHKLISKEEAKRIIETMIEQGWYCSLPLYTLIMEKLKRI